MCSWPAPPPRAFHADLSQLLFSSYSDGANLAVDPSGAIYVSGAGPYASGLHKDASNYGSLNSVSLVKIDPADSPPVIVNSIGISTANQFPADLPQSFQPEIAPGELIEIVGQHLGPGATVRAQLDATGQLPFLVGATSVSFDGYSAPLLSVEDGLILCFAPFEITGTTQVTVTADGQKSNTVRIGVAPTAAYILSIANQDGSVSVAPLPVPVASISAYIDQSQVQPQFVAAAYGMIAGITQINVQVPIAAYTSNPVIVSIGQAFAQIYISQ